ncbi:MAG: GFA family protein [Pseudomonadota bacterium]
MKRGHCLCGEVSFEYEGPELFRGHCHCESCRRQTASPFTTFMGVPDGAWRWTGREPAFYVSSPGRRRYFCPTCGAPVAFTDEAQPGEIHFYAALLEDHTDFVPEIHFHDEERVSWIELSDDLPRRQGSAITDTAPEKGEP